MIKYDQILPNVRKFMAKMSRENTKNRQKKLDWKLSPIGIDPFWRVQMSLSWKPHILCWVVFHEVPILRHIFHMSSSYRPHIVSIGVPYSAVHNVHPSGPHIVPILSSYRPQEWSNFKPRFCPPLPQMRCQRPRGQGPWKPYHSALGLKLFQIFTIRWYMCILEGKCQWYLTG